VLGGKGYDGAKADLWSCGVILYVLLVGSLPFHEDNLMVMYRKMQRGEFLCPPWVSADARNLIGGLLDPNPSTRITVARLVETPWYQKPLPVLAALNLKEPAPGPAPDARRASSDDKEEPEVLNAFHLISLSEGFDLSPLFDQGRGVGRSSAGGIRFATREAASSVVSRLESLVTTGRGANMRVTKSGSRGVRLEAVTRGRTGARLAVAAEIFSVAPSVLLVDVKKDGGDTMEYRSVCSEELRPALKDIVWASGEDTPGAA
jgi:serine/threonine protein kinase